MVQKVQHPSEYRKVTYTEWGTLDWDWENQAKLDKWIAAYFFRYDNYYKGLTNKHIIKSVFGQKPEDEIKKEIDWWYNECIGAYTQIKYCIKKIDALALVINL